MIHEYKFIFSTIFKTCLKLLKEIAKTKMFAPSIFFRKKSHQKANPVTLFVN